MHIFSSFFLFFVLAFCGVGATSSVGNTHPRIQQSFQVVPWLATRSHEGVFFGDPHRFRLLRGGGNRRDRIAIIVTTQNTSQSTLAVFDAQSAQQLSSFPVPTGAHAATMPFPPYSGWVATGPCAASRLSGVCFYTGTFAGAVAFSETGKMLWNKRLFPTNASKGTPAHVSVSGGVVWMTFENGLSSLPITALDSETGEVVWSSGAARIGFTLPAPVHNSPHGSGALFGVYDTRTNQTGFEFRVVIGTSSNNNDNDNHNTRTIKTTRAVWTNMSLSWSPPGLWDNPNFDVDLQHEEEEGNAVQQHQQRMFGYFEPRANMGNLRQFARLNVSTGAQIWQHNVHDDAGGLHPVTDFDTYAYQGDFFTLIVRKNLQITRYSGDDGATRWQTNVTSHEDGGKNKKSFDSTSILLVGSGVVCSFSLSSGLIVVLSAETGESLGRIQLPRGTTLSTGTTVALSSNRTLILFGASDGWWRGYSVEV